MLDKDKIKELLTEDNIFELLTSFGGNPTRNRGIIISDTICHNVPGEGSHKLYYYPNQNRGLFHCYTGGCENSSFDVFELVIKVFKIQKNSTISLPSAMYYVASMFGIVSSSFDFEEEKDENELINILKSIEEVSEENEIILKEYDDTLLKHLKTFRILDWEKEGIHFDTLKKYNIKYYPATEKIVIPHYDSNGRLIGIRGRALIEEDAAAGGKYMPLMISQGEQYNHPLGFSLYGLNFNKENIKKGKIAIIFEGEKSVFMLEEILDNNIGVAACGSSISKYQINELLKLGVTEICIAFDRQFEKLYSEEYKKWVKKLNALAKKFSKYVKISIILDTKLLTEYKDSPVDKGKEIFLELFNNRYFI